jgi:hypothetical protein
VTHAVLKDYIQTTALTTGVQEITQYNTEVREISKSDNMWKVDTATLQANSAGTFTHKYGSSVSYRSI